MSAEGRGLLRSAGAVPESHWDLWAGECPTWICGSCLQFCKYQGKYHQYQRWNFWHLFLDLNQFRSEQTLWTIHCWNTVPKSTSSKPPFVILWWMSLIPRWVWNSSLVSVGMETGRWGETHCLTHFLHRLLLKNTRRCFQLFLTPESASCWRYLTPMFLNLLNLLDLFLKKFICLIRNFSRRMRNRTVKALQMQ